MAPIRYTEVESRFVRQRLTSRSFDDIDHREYVEDLVTIERYVLDPPNSFGEAMQFGTARNRHPGTYDVIQEELAPERYAARKRVEAETRARRRRLTKRRRPSNGASGNESSSRSSRARTCSRRPRPRGPPGPAGR